LLIEMGCQPLLIADRLGHEKIQTTLNTYSHLLQMSTTFLHCGGADEILDQIQSLTGGGYAHVFLRRQNKSCKALYSIRQELCICLQRTWISSIFSFDKTLV